MSQNGAIQCIGAGATTWIHADISNEWSGVVYLNPDPPPMSGKSLYSCLLYTTAAADE